MVVTISIDRRFISNLDEMIIDPLVQLTFTFNLLKLECHESKIDRNRSDCFVGFGLHS